MHTEGQEMEVDVQERTRAAKAGRMWGMMPVVSCELDGGHVCIAQMNDLLELVDVILYLMCTTNSTMRVSI